MDPYLLSRLLMEVCECRPFSSQQQEEMICGLRFLSRVRIFNCFSYAYTRLKTRILFALCKIENVRSNSPRVSRNLQQMTTKKTNQHVLNHFLHPIRVKSGNLPRGYIHLQWYVQCYHLPGIQTVRVPVFHYPSLTSLWSTLYILFFVCQFWIEASPPLRYTCRTRDGHVKFAWMATYIIPHLDFCFLCQVEMDASPLRDAHPSIWPFSLIFLCTVFILIFIHESQYQSVCDTIKIRVITVKISAIYGCLPYSA